MSTEQPTPAPVKDSRRDIPRNMLSMPDRIALLEEDIASAISGGKVDLKNFISGPTPAAAPVGNELATRVAGLEAAITSVRNDFTKALQTAPEDLNTVRQAVQRLSGIEAAVESLRNDIKGLVARVTLLETPVPKPTETQ